MDSCHVCFLLTLTVHYLCFKAKNKILHKIIEITRDESEEEKKAEKTIIYHSDKCMKSNKLQTKTVYNS